MPPAVNKTDAYHEAGHAVIGILQGFRLESATGVDKIGLFPHCKWEKWNVTQEQAEQDQAVAKDFTRRHALMCVAAEFSEAVVGNVNNPESADPNQSRPDRQQGARTLTCRLLLGVGARVHRFAAKVSQTTASARCRRPPLPDQGGTQRTLPRDLSDAAAARLGPSNASWAVLAGSACVVLQLWLGHENGLEVHPLARADSLAECLLGSARPGSRRQAAMSLGLALLPLATERRKARQQCRRGASQNDEKPMKASIGQVLSHVGAKNGCIFFGQLERAI
jgi:hypothetical protein